jgi:hypothetical protein
VSVEPDRFGDNPASRDDMLKAALGSAHQR